MRQIWVFVEHGTQLYQTDFAPSSLRLDALAADVGPHVAEDLGKRVAVLPEREDDTHKGAPCKRGGVMCGCGKEHEGGNVHQIQIIVITT